MILGFPAPVKPPGAAPGREWSIFCVAAPANGGRIPVPIVRARATGHNEGFATMVSTDRAEGGSGLVREVEDWKRAEAGNRELKDRVAAALDEVRAFITERRAEIERRKGRLVQTAGFKDETAAMETALANIGQLLGSGRNISRLFAEIDKFLASHKGDDTLSRLHTRVELADARDEFMCRFHDSIRGTRLAALLDVLYFMPFAYWRSRGLDRRNYRAPSATEVLALLEQLRSQRIDVDGVDVVQLAAVIRLQLGITPRMDYHHLAGNRLAEQLTDGETLTRFTDKAMRLDEAYCRTAGAILEHLRRWSSELFAGAGAPPPAEIEAEMLQIVFLAGESVRISGTGRDRATDYLWLLATVVASDHATLKDTLAWPSVRNTPYPSVLERILGAKAYLGRIAALADGILAARWVEAKAELAALVRRSELLAARETHEFAEFAELEQLKERRSETGKALIKLADSLLLVEPAVLDLAAAAAGPAGAPAGGEPPPAPDPATLIERNRTYAAETRQIARQELDKLRALIGRMAAINRKGFVTAPAPEDADRPRAPEKPVRKTSGGVEVGGIPAARVQALLRDALRGAVASVQDSRGRIDAVRKRPVKSELLQALNVLAEKLRKTAEAGGRIVPDGDDATQALGAAEAVGQLLREALAAQTGFGARVNTAKLTPAEKQPLTTVLNAVRARLSDDLRDVECLRAELAERLEQAPEGTGPPAPAADETAAAKMAALVAAANQGLRPVKEQLAALCAALSEREADAAAILAATSRLRLAVGEARDLMARNRGLVEGIAAACAGGGDAHGEKFDRWQRQLDAVEAEAARLLTTAERVAGIEAAVREAAALDGAVPGGGSSAQRLETITRSLDRVRLAREACAAATATPWRVLKGAGEYLARGASALDACEATLGAARSRIAAALPDSPANGGPVTR
jgi:hypothetical protein